MNKDDSLIPLIFDLMFKKIFGNENDKEPIKYLLKQILNIEAKDVKILNNEVIEKPYKDKKIAVDLVVELIDGTKIVVEANTEVGQQIKDRNLFYMCRMISRNLKPKMHYNEFRKHIQINFDRDGYHEKPIMKYYMMDKDTKVLLSDKLEIVRIDVPYFYDRCYNEDVEKLNSLERFIGLFNVDNKMTAKKITKGDKTMEDIYEKMEEYNEDDEIIGAYDAEWHRSELERIGIERATKEGLEKGYQEGLKKGIEEGIEKGIEQGIDSVALKMLEENIDIKIISKVTGLSIDSIKELN